MNKNLEELKKVKRFYCVEIKKNMIPLLEDFEKRLTKLEKLKDSIESIKRNSIDTIHIGETKNDFLCIGIRKKKGENKS